MPRLYSLLAYLERYLRTDISYLMRGAFWVTVGNIATKVLVLAIAYLFANYVSKDTYGTYKYIISIASTLLIFSFTGLNTAAIKSIALGFEGMYRKAYWIRFRWSLLGSIAALTIGLLYFSAGDTILGYSFLIVAAFFPFFDTPTLYASFLNGRKLFREDALADIFITFGYAIAMGTAIFLTKNILIIITVYFGVHVIFRTITYYYVLKRYTPNNSIEPGSVSYGMHLSFMDVMITIANYIDRILLFNIAGPAQLAIYSFASAIPEQFKIMHSFIPLLGFPKWSTRSWEELQKSLLWKMGIFFIESILVIVVYILMAPYIFKIFFPQYLDAVLYSQVYVLSYLNFAPTFVTPVLQAQSRIKELYSLNAISSTGQILFLLIGGFWYGLWGIVVARVAGRVFMTVVALYYLYRKP